MINEETPKIGQMVEIHSGDKCRLNFFSDHRLCKQKLNSIFLCM